jgi:hypothetical protein
MARPAAAAGAESRGTEEGDAIYRVALALTIASGGMVAAFQLVEEMPPLTAVPALLALVGVVGRAPIIAAWAATATWVLLIPMAPGVGIAAPMAMGVLCLAFAVGPDRMARWVRTDWSGRDREDPDAAAGWIEERP